MIRLSSSEFCYDQKFKRVSKICTRSKFAGKKFTKFSFGIYEQVITG